MKVIGLIGGMSWQSTLEYYRIINQLVQDQLGGHHSARILLYSVDFDEIRQAQQERRWDDTTAILSEAGRALRRGGADFFLICTNTMHKFAEVVAERSGLPLLHIADVTRAAVKRGGLSKIGLLGTRFTMQESFWRLRLEDEGGPEVLVPPEPEIDRLDCIIFNELCLGEMQATSKLFCLEVMDRLTGQGAQGVVLGCTELPLFLKQQDVAVPLFDTTRLHAEAAARLALSPEPAEEWIRTRL